MSDTAYAQDLIREAFPKDRHGSVYSAQYAAFDYMRRAVGKHMTFRRARSIWEGAAKRIDAEEADALIRAKYEETKRAREELESRLSKLDADLAALRSEVAGRSRYASGEALR